MSSTTSSTHGSPDSPLIQPFPLSLSSPCRDLSMCPDLHTFEGTFPDGRRCGWTRSPILQAINALPSPLTRPILIRRPVRKAGSSNKPSPFAVPLAFLRFFFPPLRPRPDAAIPCWRQYRAHVPAPRQFCICSLSPSLVQVRTLFSTWDVDLLSNVAETLAPCLNPLVSARPLLGSFSTVFLNRQTTAVSRG